MATAVHVMQSSAASSTTSLQTASTTAPVLEFVCLFTHDLRRKQKRWQDGRLKYHTFNKRVMVYDERGNFVGDTHWREDFPLGDGEELELERGGTIVQVAECTGRRDQDLSELIDKRAQEKAQRQSAAAARRHPTLEPATPQAAEATAPHFQLRHRPLHHLIGTPTGHHGRALVSSESPYEQRRQQLEALPAQDDANRPAKRRKRDISPPSKSGYAQSLFGATLTLSGRPMSSAPIHHRPSNAASARQSDLCPTSSDRSNRESEIEQTSLAPRAVAVPANPRGASARSHLLTNVSRRPPESPPRSTELHRASSPILVEDNPQRRRLPSAAHNHTQNHASRSPKPTRDGRLLDGNQRNPLQPLPAKENHDITNDASRIRDGSTSKHRSHDDRPVGKITRKREERQQSSGTRQSKMRRETNCEVTSHNHAAPTDVMSLPKPTKSIVFDDTAREGPDAQVSMEKPRTELRIRPRKKPGLVMLSGKTSGSKSKPERKIVSTKKIPVDDSMPEEQGVINSKKHRKTRVVLERSILQDHNTEERPEQESRNRHSEAARQTTVPAEDIIQIGDDLPERLDGDRTARRSLEKRQKRRDRASTPSMPLHSTGNKDLDVLSDDAYEDAVREAASKVSRRKRLKRVAEDEDDAEPETSSPSKSRNQRSRKTKSNTVGTNQTFEEPHTDPYQSEEEEEPSLAEEAPTPRIAKIKNGIRSKELIGFYFHDEDDEEGPGEASALANGGVDAPQHVPQNFQMQQPRAAPDVAQLQNSKAIEPPQTTAQQFPSQDNVLQSLSEGVNIEKLSENGSEQSRNRLEDQIPPARVAMTTNLAQDTGLDQDVSLTKPQPLSNLPRNPEHLTKTNLDTESGAQQIILTDTDPARLEPPSVSNPTQRQDSLVQEKPNLGGNVQQPAREETIATLPKSALGKKILNPATRGRKAAKPSDAAGQLPQCPLPLEVRPVGLPRPVNVRKPGEAGDSDERATPPSGFVRANGGPWSREAFDLFEFRRPT